MTDPGTAKPAARWGGAVVVLAIAALHLALVAGLPVWLLGHAALDDALFLRSAEYLAAGDWLGPYDNRTLARGPFYSMFIALAFHAGVPIRVAQSVLYLAAGALLLWAVQPWPGPRWTRVAAFGAFAFDPMLYHTDLLRVVREGVYVPLAVLVVALCAASLRARDAALPLRIAWAGLLGVACAALWLTREEGPWILPALATAALALVATRYDRPGARRALIGDACAIGVGAAIAVACVQGVAWQNYRHYGTWCSVEFRQADFESAYGALLRIDPDERKPFVPITRDSLRRAAAAGPAAATLAGVLQSGIRDGFARYGCEHHNLVPCDGEFRGGWFMFAMRDAVALAGQYTSGREAARFYATLAQEVDDACGDGRLVCGPKRRGFAPPLAPGDLAAIAANALRGAVQVVGFTGFALAPAASTGRESDLARYSELLHARVFARGDPPREFSDGDRVRSALLNVIAIAYRWLVPPLAIAAAIAFAWTLRRTIRALATPWIAVTAILAAAIASRIVIVSIVATTSIPILEPRYLSSAYPLLLLFAGIGVAGGLELTRSPRR